MTSLIISIWKNFTFLLLSLLLSALPNSYPTFHISVQWLQPKNLSCVKVDLVALWSMPTWFTSYSLTTVRAKYTIAYYYFLSRVTVYRQHSAQIVMHHKYSFLTWLVHKKGIFFILINWSKRNDSCKEYHTPWPLEQTE